MYNFHGGIQAPAYKEDIYSKKPTHLKTPNIETLDVSKTSKEKTDSAVSRCSHCVDSFSRLRTLQGQEIF